MKNITRPYTAAGTPMVVLFSRAGLSATVIASVLLWMPISNPAATAARCSTPANRGTPYPTSRLSTLKASTARPTATK